ncbi:MAG TPA: CPBP family intramembrane glutamic endopeptidase, partial [Acidobacteriota bacterium]|nr:CPBP family intramembrane glutamic endopeptidase [Acidobacteriota bacterium]
QNLLKERMGSGLRALVIASVVFGLTHMNKVTVDHGVPNFPYVLMASLAGVAYGWVWQKTSKISASAITHATVNCVWHALLSG